MISAAALKKAVHGKRVLIDSNIVIYLTDSIEPYEPLAQTLFRTVETGDAEAVFSILSIVEVMQGPLRKGHNHIATKVRDYLVNFPNSICQDITFDVLEKIGNDDRVNWKTLRAVDSLIIASGLFHNVHLIVSNDKHFQSSLPKDFILTLD